MGGAGRAHCCSWRPSTAPLACAAAAPTPATPARRPRARRRAAVERVAAAEGCELVDPDGLEAEPGTTSASSCGRTRWSCSGATQWARQRLAARGGLDATAIWEWGVVERVSTGLLGAPVSLQPMASQMLAAADAVAP